MDYAVVDKIGKKVKDITLNDAIFGLKFNKTLVYEAVLVERANKRAGLSFFKNRAMVTATGKKLYRQKGTGYARHGAKSSNIFVGGGAAFGGQRHNFSMSMPRKMKKKALFTLLSLRVNEEKIKILDSLVSETGKTKEIFSVLSGIVNLDKKVLLISEHGNTLLKQSVGNIQNVQFIDYKQLNVLSVFQANEILTDVSVIEKMNSWVEG